jgi:polyisoprenoid-binding protein YceI
MFERRILSELHFAKVRFVVLCLIVTAAMLVRGQEQPPAQSEDRTPAQGQDQIPVFRTTPGESTIKFTVKASVAIVGTFQKWHSNLVFKSTDVSTGVLDIKIEADSVHTGSGMKDGKLRGKDFFDVKEYPVISFHSDKIVQTGPNTFDVPGTFTIRGVSKPETVTFSVTREGGAASGDVKGTMAFDRKDYGMDKGIPFVTIADRVEVALDLKVKRVSGPPLAFKQ